MTAMRALELVVLVVLVAVLLVLVPRTWWLWRVYAGIRHRRLQDGSSFAPPPSAAVAALSARLHPLGFERIGERTLVLPGGLRRFEWDLVDTSSTTYVAVGPVDRGARMTCYSAFADGAFVETAYPVGTALRRPDLVASVVQTSPQDAVTAHRQLLTECSATHGRALENRTMADLLERDATYRVRHGGATMRRRVYGRVASTAIAVLFAASVLVSFLVTDG